MRNTTVSQRLARLRWALAVGGLAAALTAAAPTEALDRLAIQIPKSANTLRGSIGEASQLVAAQRAGRTDSQELFSAARADYERLVNALYAQGYYSSVIHILIDGREAADISSLAVPAEIRDILVTIDPGPIFRFGTASVEPLAKDTMLPGAFAPGKIARSPVIGEAATAAVAAWQALGYPKATLAGQSVIADHTANQIDAELAVDPGPQLRFGAFGFTGAQGVRKARVRAIAGVRRGKLFTPDNLSRINTRLLRSGAFKSVSLRQAEVPNPDGTLDVNATLIEEKPRRIGFGGEIASLDGATVSGYWLHRNILGGAERLRFDGEISGIGAQRGGTDYKVGATLTRPATFDADTSLTFGATVARLNEKDFNSYNYGLNVGLERIFSKTLTGTIGVAFEHSDVTDSTGSTTFDTLSLPAGLLWDRRDIALNPTKGFYVNGRLTPFTELGTSSLGTRAYVDTRAYQGFGDGRFVLAARAQVGSILGTSLRDTPRDMLFYSGGPGTVRGQPYQSLGVFALGDNQRSGGRSFFATSAEVRLGITDTIGMVGFFDAGFVGEGDMFDQTGNWHSGAGMGVRYNTGIGPIRFDIALPVSGDTGKGLQFYIGIGQAF